MQSREADQFAETIGLNVHLSSQPYAGQLGRLQSLTASLGVRHFRDELRPDNDVKLWRKLHARLGVRSHWLISPATNTLGEMLDMLSALGPETISAVEGQNEGDSDWFIAQKVARPDWAAAVIDYQRAAFTALRARYTPAALPVVSPSLLDYRPEDVRRIAPAAPYCDWVAIHAYAQGGQEPETEAAYAGLPWYLRAFRDQFKPGAPAVATEAGYHTVRAKGVSERAASIYLPRLLLHAARLGIVRTFLYEFMDGGADPADSEQNYGLLYSNAKPKPAYHALRSLIGALADPGPRFSPAPVALELDGPSDLQSALFQRRAGNLVLALWRSQAAWNPVARTDLAPAPATVRVRLAYPVDAEQLTLGEGLGWIPLPRSPDHITVVASETVSLLRLTTR